MVMPELGTAQQAERSAWASYMLVLATGADAAKAKDLWLSTVRVRARLEPRGG